MVESLEADNDFITARLDKATSKWVLGERVHVISVGDKKFIRTDRNSTAKDNLGELPEY